MSRTSVGVLSRDELAILAARIFGQRELSLMECAATYSLSTLCETLTAQCAELVDAVGAAPARAFERQLDDADGSDVWSAGQVVSHLASTTMLAIPFWEAVSGARIEPPGEAALRAIDARLLDQDQSIAAARDIRIAGDHLSTMLQTARQLAGPVAHFRLGMIDGPAALLATCIHTADHNQQIRDLAKTWKSW